MSKITWVLVANSAQARIFKNDGDRKVLTELEGLVHTQSRFHGKDITTDRPGRTHESHTKGLHGTEPQTTPKQHEAQTFAKEIGQHIEKASQNGAFDKIYVIATPSFLGLLRQNMGSLTQQRLADELNKDLVSFKPEEIREHLPYVL